MLGASEPGRVPKAMGMELEMSILQNKLSKSRVRIENKYTPSPCVIRKTPAMVLY